MYIFASAHYSFLSSTGVKEIATFGGDVGDLVPEPVAKALASESSGNFHPGRGSCTGTPGCTWRIPRHP